MANTFLRDVEYRDTKTVTCVQVPTPQAGTYENDGVKQAVCATLWLPKGRMMPNKKQDGVTTRGWCVLDPTHTYTVSWSQQDNPSIHSDRSRRRLKLTGAQIVAANDTFGRPALEKARREQAKAPQTHGQLRLFGDDYSPTYKVGEQAQCARTPIDTPPECAREPDPIHNRGMDF